ncbi:EF-hand domain-containing protein [Rhodobacteraceae bacterium 63075]|nr:EF-hand domain-containing protein [Rhodobacteraceae bacterium 63075]
MNKFARPIAALAVVMTPALAIGEGAMEVDADGNGVLSFDEVRAVWPDITPEVFAVMDSDADGVLTDEEVEAAQDAGMLQLSE